MHAYDRNGNPVYEVPNVSKGGVRPTTIADVRKLKLAPSVTEVTGQLDKPALLQWKVDKVLNEVYTSGVSGDFNFFKTSVLRSVAKEAEKAPKLGNAIHDEFEQWFKREGRGAPPARLGAALDVIAEDVGCYKYIPEKSFYHPLGFGGKVDLHSELGVVLDFKTKDTLDINKMKGYKEHIMQLAAYRHGLKIPKARCYNLFISSQDTSIVKLVEYTEAELNSAWEMFKCLLKFWQINNKMEILV